jgi:hypothetical protein
MAMVDLRNVPNADEGINTVPPGQYLVQLVRKEDDANPKDNSLVWKLAAEIQHGPLKGQLVFDSLYWKDSSMSRVKLVLKRLGIPADDVPFDTDRLILEGRVAVITIIEDVYKKEATGVETKSLKIPFAGWERPDAKNLNAIGAHPDWESYAAKQAETLNLQSGIVVDGQAAPAAPDPAPAPAAAASQVQPAAVQQELVQVPAPAAATPPASMAAATHGKPPF